MAHFLLRPTLVDLAQPVTAEPKFQRRRRYPIVVKKNSLQILNYFM